MARHRRAKPRVGRIALAATSVTITLVALAGGVGLLRHDPAGASASAVPAGATFAADPTGPADQPAGTTDAASGVPGATERPSPAPVSGPPTTQATPAPDDSGDETLPAGSGRGRRVVFSEGRQRVWLVSGGQRVKRTYLVSGSLYDNLDPGSYEVYSRSEDARGVDGSSMHRFVRFTQGDHAAIGFHTIPELGGEPVQTAAQLGTPLSHGCIRQRERDALAMWYFAQIGTTVVVTA